MFKSTRSGKNRSRVDENKSSDVSKTATSRSYAAFPTPYQYQPQTHKGSPSMQPVFMHEPYRSRPQSPAAYETLHSPIPSQDNGHYHQNQVAYPKENVSQTFPSHSYHRPSIALPNPISSFSHSKPNDLPPSARQEANNYYPSSAPSPSWSDESGLNYSDSPSSQHLELGVPSSPMTQPYPSTYSLANHAAENGDFEYTYQAPAPMQNHPTSLYSTSCPLNSGYTPIPTPSALTLPSLPERGPVHLSPLSIPERSNGVHYSQDSSPISPMASPILQTVPESYTRTAVPALAPLNIIRRPVIRREPLDEMTLRLLRAPQPNP
jgi:hypothetical protein